MNKSKSMSLSMRTKTKLNVVLIAISALLLAVYVWPQGVNKGLSKVQSWVGAENPWQLEAKPFSLGLDLQGGSHLVYEADVSKVAASEVEASVEGVRDVIEKRVNAFGVSEPQVQTNKSGDSWRIIVELAGIKDVKEAINMIGATPLLEFKELNTEPLRSLTAEEKTQMDQYNKDAEAKAKGLLEQAKANPAGFEELASSNSELVPNINLGLGDDVKISANIDLDYVDRSNATYEALYKAAEVSGANTIVPNLVEWNGGWNVVRVLDKKEEKPEYHAAHILVCYKGATACTQERSKEEALALITELKAQAVVGDAFYTLAKEKSDESIAKDTGGELGWFAAGVMVKPFEDAVSIMTVNTISDIVETDFGYHIIWKIEQRTIPEYHLQHLWVARKTEADIIPPQERWKNTELSGKDLKRADIVTDQYIGTPEISLEFTDTGKDLFAAVTERNVGKPIAIFLDGMAIVDSNGDGVISEGEEYAPVVQQAITDGKAVIQGQYTMAEAKTLKQRLNAGALPVPITMISQETVGATLGQESLTQSLKAGLWGFLILALFMIAYYRLPGLLAVIALTFYALLVLSVFRFIPVTLTLAGIAGFVLSIGMAVDANVLIFERLREELKNNKPLSLALQDAFKRAWPAIFDGNMSTLITCLILMWFGSSMIKGFAITLTIGILMSMFTAMVITKILLMFSSGKSEKISKWLYRV
jgi:protein-export membrane protein SecD